MSSLSSLSAQKQLFTQLQTLLAQVQTLAAGGAKAPAPKLSLSPALFGQSGPVSIGQAATLAPLTATNTSNSSLSLGTVRVQMVQTPEGDRANSSRVVLPFSQAVTLLDANKISLKGTLLSPTGQWARTVNIPVKSAQVDPANPKNVILTTDGLVPKGAQLSVGAGAVKFGNNKTNSAMSKLVLEGASPIGFTLSNRAFKATDKKLFTPGIFTDAPVPTIANQPVDPAVVSANFNSFMDKKIQKGKISAADKTAMVARFNDPAVAAIIPDANLRASLLSLKGTAFEPAIGAILDGQNSTGRPYSKVEFGPTSAFAESFVNPDGSLKIVFNESLKGEPFQALSALMAHEPVHQDLSNGLNEETVGWSMETLAYSEQLLIDPSIASKGTNWVNTSNEKLLAMLNSGKHGFPGIGIKNAPLKGDQNVYVGGRTFSAGPITSFENLANRVNTANGVTDVDTSGNSTIDAYLSRILGRNVSGVGLNDDAISLLDREQQVISRCDAFQLARILKLSV